VDNLLALLADGLNNPTKRLSELDIMPETERHLVVQGFNNTSRNYDQSATVSALISAQAARIPQKTALVYRDQKLSYEALNAMADRMAGELSGLGLGPERIVGILADRSLEMIVAMVAVLKTGSAFLPIDPAYPEERIEYMLADSQACLLLSHRHLKSKAKAYSGMWRALDDLLSLESPQRDLPCGPKPNDLAYIIYTSGSTGKPKGVMIEHKALANLCAWQNEYHGITEKDVTAEFSAFGFDASMWEIFPFLTCGATVHILEDGLRYSPSQVNDYFEEHGITVADLPTQFAEQFMETTENRSLRTLVLGGDKLKFVRPQNYRVVN
jgi:non-ribosomal peptide synthetase component F